jgi:hypothetical protein
MEFGKIVVRSTFKLEDHACATVMYVIGKGSRRLVDLRFANVGQGCVMGLPTGSCRVCLGQHHLKSSKVEV